MTQILGKNPNSTFFSFFSIMDKLSPLPSLQPSPFNTSPDIKQQGAINGTRTSSQQFPISLPPIKEGEHYTNSNSYEPGNEFYSLASRRFSLPSINSFDQPTPQNWCSPAGFRKLSLPTSSFQGFTNEGFPNEGFPNGGFPNEGFPNDSEMHACQYPGCFWSFKRSEHLKRHMTVHTRERPFLCTYPNCNRGFSRSDNLNVHYRSHFDPNSVSNRELNYEDVLNNQDSSPTMVASTFKKNFQQPYTVCQRAPKTKFQNTTYASFSSGPRLPSIAQSDSCNLVTLPSIDQIAGRSKNLFEPQSHHSYSRPEIDRDFDGRYSKPSNHPTPLEQLANVASISFMVPVNPTEDASKNQVARSKVPETDSKLVWTDLDDEGRPIKYYVCQFKGCNMKFKRSEHLTRHRLVHTMERPFSCAHPGCNKAFSRADNLRQHTRIHTRPHPGHVGHPAFNTIRVANSTPYLKNQNELTASQPVSRKP